MPELGAGQIRNHDCVHMISLIDRALLEVKDSVSAGLNDYREADKKRLSQYLDNMTFFMDFSSKLPEMDRPHSHPLLTSFPDSPVPVQPEMDNLAAKKLIHSLNVFRVNVGACQSADLSNGYMLQDQERFYAEIQHCKLLLSDYIDKAQPTDYPETSKPHV